MAVYVIVYTRMYIYNFVAFFGNHDGKTVCTLDDLLSNFQLRCSAHIANQIAHFVISQPLGYGISV